MNNLAMDNSNVRIAHELITRLLDRRSNSLENQLCLIVRKLSESQKLVVVEELAKKNVRLAADIAARGHLAIPQQQCLFRKLLESGNSNAIKQFITKLFVVRLGVKKILKVLQEYREKNPNTVQLAAYYLGGEMKFASPHTREAFAELSCDAQKKCGNVE